MDDNGKVIILVLDVEDGYNPPTVLFSAAVAYVLSGPTGWLVSRLFSHRAGAENLDREEKARW